ncbi:MAG TPA: OmpH family outer membrane protein [Paludibacter sp.]|nr:OmpH family outer membrane protein [Paludibacter sp.]
MKNLSLILNGILLIAVIFLFVKVYGDKPEANGVAVFNPKDSTGYHKLPIAYVNIDSLLINYQFAKEANETLISRQEESRLSINTRARTLESEMGEFQKKLENNAFLSRERAEQEQARLLKKRQELQDLDGQLSQQLMQSQQKMSEQLRDTINAFLKGYNKNKGYEIIFSNTSSDNILLTSNGYDITTEVTKLLNERYNKKK